MGGPDLGGLGVPLRGTALVEVQEPTPNTRNRPRFCPETLESALAFGSRARPSLG
jgi:hypothetical protein